MTAPSVVLVNSGDPRDRVGGARLRWDAIADGLERWGRLHRFEPWCDGSCGRPHPQDSAMRVPVGWMPAHDPFFEFYCPQQALRLLDLIHRVDPRVVIGSGLEMARYLSLVSDRPTVVDFKDVDSDVRRDIGHATQARMAHRTYRRGDYERYVAPQTIDQLEELQRAAVKACRAVWTCTDRDRDIIVSRYGIDHRRVHVVPNAVRIPALGDPAPAPPSRVVFVGKLNYFPCVQAAEFIIEELAPLLRTMTPSVQVILAGARPSPDLVKAATDGGVQVAVDPPDVTPYWSNSILVVPLTVGSGSRLKIIEAFAHHCPVVTTAKGVEGIAATPQTHYLPAESAAQFAHAVRRLCEEESLRVRLARNGREFASAHHSIDSVATAIATTLIGLP